MKSIINLPELTGSEKQIAWAKDILVAPYERLCCLAEHNLHLADKFDQVGGGNDYREDAAACTAAAGQYAAMLTASVSSLSAGISAVSIIESKTRYMSIARDLLRKELRARGCDISFAANL